MNQLAEVKQFRYNFLQLDPTILKRLLFFFSFWLVLWLVLGIEPRTFYILNRCSPTKLYA